MSLNLSTKFRSVRVSALCVFVFEPCSELTWLLEPSCKTAVTALIGLTHTQMGKFKEQSDLRRYVDLQKLGRSSGAFF